MDGFEPNGFLLEECQELQEITFKKAKLRAGRNAITPMPKPLVICTGNPSQGWPKSVFYEPFIEGKLPPRFKYIVAKMSDNKMLGDEYKEALETLDELTRSRYVDGNWDAVDVQKPFFYAFKLDKHTDVFEDKPLVKFPLYLSFDFNKDPITCIASQHDGLNWVKVYREFRLLNSDIDELCDAIKATYNLDDYYVIINGDASGATSTALNKNRNYYVAIKENLGIETSHFKIRKSNPGIKNNRVLCNALLQRHPNIKFNRKLCKYLIEDLMYIQVKEVAEGIEINKNKDKHKSHLADCLRYYFDMNFPNFVKYKV
jgi:phage terminase large subunit